MNYDDAIALIKGAPNSEDASVSLEEVEGAEVSRSEQQLGRTFPAALKELWASIGYGSFKAPLKGGDRTPYVNMLMHPSAIVDTYRTYSDEFGDALPFFDVSDEDYLLIQADGWIRHSAAEDMLLAKDLHDFIERIADDPMFWASGNYLQKTQKEP